MTNIVIVGGGFAGVNAFLELDKQLHRKARLGGKAQVTMISESDKFLFVPLIHEVATGTLSPDDVGQPIRQITDRCLRFVEAKVESIDLDKQEVMYSRAGFKETISFDYLVLAAGAQTNFFGVPGAAEHALSLKNIKDARALKNRFIDNFVKAEQASAAEQQRLLRFVVVGGGPTGVELAGEMSDFFRQLKKAFPRFAAEPEIVLVEAADRLVCKMEGWFGEQTAGILQRKGNVRVVCGAKVSEITQQSVRLDHEFIETACVLWAAGVQARDVPITAAKILERDNKTKRIKVNNYLQVPLYTNVFVAGDQAWIYDKEEKQPYPMRAQFAVREGKRAGSNIINILEGKPLSEFDWNDMGIIVSLGKGGALAKIGNIKVSGFAAWWLYRTAYLFNMVGLRTQLRTAAEWFINLFLPRDISKL